MKKFMTIFTILFVFMTMTFGQNVIKDTEFHLNGGGSFTDTGFSVAVNPTYPTAISAEGTMVVTFNNLIDFVSVTSNDGAGNPCIDVSNVNVLKLENGAVYGVTFNYVDMMSGDVIFNYNPNTTFKFFTEQDTVNAHTNGVNSVDTQSYFDAGMSSVDTTAIWESGYDAGIVEGENTAADDAYNAGFADGSGTGTNVNTFAVTNLNVYPNPVNKSGDVTVDCDDFNNVKIFTITGQEIYTSYVNNFNVSDFTNSTGTYLLRVEDDQFNVTNKRLIVQE
jgi:hypothetical protein